MIGRIREQQILNDLYHSGEAEFVVVYGRRRVGKTYLIRETFADNFFFCYTGIANINAKQQRTEFAKTLKDYGWNQSDDGSSQLCSWFECFAALRSLIKAQHSKERLVIFIDEMPWMDNKKSDFVQALEHFWNGWAASQKNIMLIVCGSAASWITKNIFRNRGGLYNRVTRQISLKPFTLSECSMYYDSRGISMNTQDIIESYMIFGGIPYYLRFMEKRYSLALNVDRICFEESAPLRNEYNRLIDSLFLKPEKYRQILEVLYTKKKGLTREAIAQFIDFGNGGNLSRILNELEECCFIRKSKPYGKKTTGSLYYLSDFFVAFHLTFMKRITSENFWSTFTNHARHRAWSGFAFEQVCFAHVFQIRKSLGISGINSDVSSWVSKQSEPGAQIDMLIDRADRVINIIEVKFANSPFVIDKAYDLNLRNKMEAFRSESKTKKALHLTLITTYGVKQGKYSSIVQSEVRMDDLLVYPQ